MAKHRAIAMPEYKEPTVEEKLEQRRDQSYEHTEHEVDQRVVAHDAAGVESHLMDFSEYSDGYGNNVAHGDLSIQHLTEERRVGAGRNLGYVRPYDTEPFQNEAQHRKFRSMEAAGEIPAGTSSRWAHKTPKGNL